MDAEFDEDEEAVLNVDTPESEEDLDFLVEQRENVAETAKVSEIEESTETVLEPADEPDEDDVNPMIVASIDDLINDDEEADETSETFSFDGTDFEEDEEEDSSVDEYVDKSIDESAGDSDDSVDSDFKIDFSSDHEGESSFTQSLPDDEEDIAADVVEKTAALEDSKAAGAVAVAEEVDKLAQAAALSTQMQDEEEKVELPPYEVPDVKDVLKEVVKEKDDKLEAEIQTKAKVLAQTLKDFKVNATILGATHGPAVTRYEVKLAPGVKVNKLTGLADDIALSMAATSVRIEQIPNHWH